MRVAMMTAGSRGDVAPFTGLGAGLVRAGHDVTLLTHDMFEPLTRGSGIRFHPLPVDPRAELHSERGQGLHRSGTGVGKLLRAMSMGRAVVGQFTDSLIEVARDSDVLVLSGVVAPLGCTVAEGLKLPSVGVNLQPMHATRAFAPPLATVRSLGPVGNRLAGHAVTALIEQIFTRAAPEARRRLRLPPLGVGAARRARERQGWPVLYGFSPQVVPRPADWRPGLDVVGYWWPHDVQDRLPAELEDFLAAGPAPVYVGLGSATVPDPDRLCGQVVQALRAAGLRGVIQRGWAGLSATGDDVLTIDDVPHSLLFPRTAAVVHHCGAGTTAAGLRAGVPAVPVPIQFDEMFWASRLTALGTAPYPLPLRRLTTQRLTDALIRATNDPVHRERARRVAARLAAEDAVGPVRALLQRIESGEPEARVP
ncbi:UDP:flavonoid glycosyltransferase YjiC (YdhE family) [Streptomyces spectabilis]|uniref:UDP:flavonoid glycosyltransferase YjiC (YdhE family) n=2 Tax=Streptomyces spectabilis TaxID=68270 RepID=A0A7W8ER92_STRST|nr:UDP:flavonoid glycosyltransferase YjiC (YdhE family) [Streptomyces spectabilis]